MAPLRQANWPGLHRSSVGQRQEALSTRPTRHVGQEQEGPPEPGAQVGTCSHLHQGGSVTGHNLGLWKEQRRGFRKRLERDPTGQMGLAGPVSASHLPGFRAGAPRSGEAAVE